MSEHLSSKATAGLPWARCPRLHQVGTALLACLVGALLAPACTNANPEPLVIRDDEPVGEAREPFGSKAFRFEVVVRDDRKDKAGGWQKATADLLFILVGVPPREWHCTLGIGMPIRSELEGRITPSRAAFFSAEIATEVGHTLLPGWEGPTGLFCARFRDGIQHIFDTRYPGIGAKVSPL